MALRLIICLVLFTILSSSFAEDTVDSLKAQLASKNAEIKQLKAQLQDCDLGSLLQKKGKEVSDLSVVYFHHALDSLQKGWVWLSQHATKYGKIAGTEAQKYSALATDEINKLAKQYKFEAQLDEVDKTWRNLVKTSVNQVSESVPQTASYLKPIKDNPVLVGQSLALSVVFFFLLCFVRCCCCRGSQPKKVPTASASTAKPPKKEKK